MTIFEIMNLLLCVLSDLKEETAEVSWSRNETSASESINFHTTSMRFWQTSSNTALSCSDSLSSKAVDESIHLLTDDLIDHSDLTL